MIHIYGVSKLHNILTHNIHEAAQELKGTKGGEGFSSLEYYEEGEIRNANLSRRALLALKSARKGKNRAMGKLFYLQECNQREMWCPI